MKISQLIIPYHSCCIPNMICTYLHYCPIFHGISSREHFQEAIFCLIIICMVLLREKKTSSNSDIIYRILWLSMVFTIAYGIYIYIDSVFLQSHIPSSTSTTIPYHLHLQLAHQDMSRGRVEISHFGPHW